MANEKPLEIIDYIDRYKVLELLGNRAEWFSEPPMDSDDFMKLKLVIELETEIRKLPTLDAKEVKYGEWIRPTMLANMMHNVPHCSICGEVPCDEGKYCPHCGAKMDGGKK